MKTKSIKKRLSKIAKELNVGISTITDFLQDSGYDERFTPNSKITEEQYSLLLDKYGSEKTLKQQQVKARKKEAERKKTLSVKNTQDENDNTEQENKEEEKVIFVEDKTSSGEKTKKKAEPKIIGKIDLDQIGKPKKKTEPKKKETIKEKTEKKEDVVKTEISENKEVKNNKEEKTKEEKTEKKQISEEKQPEKETIKENKDEKNKPEKKEEIKKADDIKKETKKEPVKEIKTEEKQKNKPAKKENKKKVKENKKEKAEEKSDNEKDENKIENKIKVVGKIDLSTINQRTRPARKSRKEREAERKKKDAERKKANDKNKKNDDSSNSSSRKRKRKRVERVQIDDPKNKKYGNRRSNKRKKGTKETDQQDIDKQIKETLAKLENRQKSKAAKHRRSRRDEHRNIREKELEQQQQEQKTIKITEFITVNELANMMEVHVNQLIGTCMDLSIHVAINTRLDSETISILAEEYGFDVEFISTKTEDEEYFLEEDEENLMPRPPIITVMGHVDHGKTSLLDHIRKANVIAGEAGGITQHIGAYHVTMQSGDKITFLDTPGHEAFTAMRARGAKVTDVVIIIIAADDNIMPQTIEAIDHAKAADVPIVFAINKVDKPGADPEKIKRQLADRNYLIEEWGGQYGCVEISAKFGKNVDALLERVLLEAEVLELQANPDRNALGTVVESTLDKGRGFVTTLLLKTGTLKIGDFILVGQFTGKVKAMFNERGRKVKKAGPSEPVLVLGLNGAPEAGDPFVVMDSEREAKDKANYRQQLQREISFRAQKLLTLDEIGRRIQVGDFQELNLVVKGDVIGSIEAISDAVSKLSTEEIQVNIIHKAVGQISDNDIMLAVASKAIVLGFQVRPSLSARKLAEKNQIEIRQYSVIFDVINDIRAAMEGMLSPEIKEEIVGTAEILKTFKIGGVGTIAGCAVREGKILRTSKVKLIRDGIVKYTGELGSLKRYKDDAKEVMSGQECGLNIDKFNDIKVGDIIEAFKEIEVKKTL